MTEHQSSDVSRLIARLYQHAYDLLHGGTNAGDLCADLRLTADQLTLLSSSLRETEERIMRVVTDWRAQYGIAMKAAEQWQGSRDDMEYGRMLMDCADEIIEALRARAALPSPTDPRSFTRERIYDEVSARPSAAKEPITEEAPGRSPQQKEQA